MTVIHNVTRYEPGKDMAATPTSTHCGLRTGRVSDSHFLMWQKHKVTVCLYLDAAAPETVRVRGTGSELVNTGCLNPGRHPPPTFHD